MISYEGYRRFLGGSPGSGSSSPLRTTSSVSLGPSGIAPSTPLQPLPGPSLSALGQDLSSLVANFRAAAAPPVRLSDSDRDTLRSAVLSGSGIDDARSILNRSYGGPGGLDSGRLEEIRRGAASARDYYSGLAEGRGILAHIQSRGGLTAGEAEFEARRGARNVIADALGELRSARELLSRADTEEAAAARTAERKRAGALKAARYAGSFVEGLARKIRSPLEAEARALAAKELALSRAFERYQRSGDPLDLRDWLSESQLYILEGGDEKAQIEKAKGRREQILGLYPDIAHYRPAYIRADPGGRAARIVQIDGEFLDIDRLAEGRIKGKEHLQALGQRLAQRQDRLESFFSRPAKGRLGLELDFYAPLYGGAPGFRLPDEREFVGLNAGTVPELGAVASAEEIAQLNRAAELLGLENRLEPGKFRPSELDVDTEAYARAIAQARERRARELKEWAAGKEGQLRALVEDDDDFFQNFLDMF